MRLGFAPGLQWTREHTTFDVLQSGSDCGQFQQGTRNQAGFELFFETPLAVSPSLLFIARAGFAHNVTELTSGETSLEARQNGETYFVTRRHHFRTPLEAVKIGAGGAWELMPGLRLAAAPTLTFLSAGEQQVTEELVDPPGADFIDSLGNHIGNQRRVSGATQVEFKSLLFGVDLGIAERLPLGERLAIHPEVRVSIGLGSVARNVSWTESGFQLLLGISYDIARHPEPGSEPLAGGGRQDGGDKPADEPRKWTLRATIDAKGEDESGNLYDNPVIEIEEAPWVESVPIIPSIFFDSASATIAPRYVLLRSTGQADRFKVDSLLGITPLEIHWQLLNVVGERMRANPAKRVIITGSVSNDEAAGADAEALGRDRAEQVARYLTEIWRVPRGRIEVVFDHRPSTASPEGTIEGREENRRAEIRFSDEEIARPVVIHRLATIASPPAVRFFPEIEADAPVTDWHITVVQGDRELLRFEGEGEDSLESSWSLGDRRVTRDMTPIRYRLTVHDSLGQEATADGAFRVMERVRQRDTESDGKHTEVAEYSLVGFNYSSAELLPRHMAQLQEVASAMDEGAIVTIAGYTDRVGDADRNRQLSLDRARAVQSALRSIRQKMGLSASQQIAVRGLGNETEVFNNDLPEGRLLSRMVRITITRQLRR